jgi:hypothetical protein
MAAKISEGNAAVPPIVKARLEEATVPVAAGAQWFTVLASLPEADEAAARRDANKKLDQLKASNRALNVVLYRTKVSKNLAIVLDGPTDRQTAIALAAEARKSDLAKDAFAQQDRSWTLIGRAPFPQ